MTTTDYWGSTIRDPWFRLTFAALLVASAALADTASVPQLGQGIGAFRSQNYPSAVQHLRSAQLAIPKLADYIVFHLASAEKQTGDLEGAVRDLTQYRQNPVSGSPLAGKISLLLAKALLEQRQPAANTQAVQILENDYKTLPEPDGDSLLAMAYEAMGEGPQAALVYERVYYGYPNTTHAADAWTAMERLRNSIGPNYPRPSSKQQLQRCERWIAAKEYFKARLEYDSLAKSLPEPERDDAKVGVGAAQYLSGDYNSAFRYLKNLHVAKSESDSQRLYYVTESARKMGDDTEMMSAVKILSQKYPQSVWRLKALVTAGNRYLLTNDREKYAPLYKAASDTFPEDNSTAYCHWKFTWDAYLAGRADAPDLLKEQVERYPADGRASTALYFLGRIAENKNADAEARAFYDRLSSQYPHYFYGVLARQRLAAPKLSAVPPAAGVKDWLDKVEWPEHRDLSASEPNPATRQRIERARVLYAAGLPDIADAEIRFGAKSEGEQPQLLSLEMASTAESPFRSLRVMKSFSADYLSLPLENAPKRFWQMLFPLPYKEEVFRYAKSKNLDPYYVAALIRQESEFNPAALSPARAYGLMQLVPSTGKMVGRQEGVSVPSAGALFNPTLNIRLGTHYLRGQLDTWSGNWEQTLAAYNAGPGRVREWLTWSNYREPAEFVESIPFSETREYVQAVLRNADMYRQIYSSRAVESAPEQLAFAVEVPEYGATGAALVGNDRVAQAAVRGPSAQKRIAVPVIKKSRAIRRVASSRVTGKTSSNKSRKQIAASKKPGHKKHA